MTRSPESAPFALPPEATPLPETPPWEAALPGAGSTGPGDDDDDDEDDAPAGGGGGNIDPDDDEGYADDDEDDDEEPLQCAPCAARREFTLRRSILW